MVAKPLKWGIVGCGDITAKRVAPALLAHPQCRLAAFCSGSQDRAKEFADRFDADMAFGDLDAMLAQDIDCVYVASRVSQHADQSIRALRAGKHVLCEKPLALDSAQCDAMLAAEAQTGRKLGVAYYRRFYPSWVRAKEIALSGGLGDIVAVRIILASYWNISPDDPKSWRLSKALSGGGPLADVGSHRLDLLVDLLGLPLSVAAYAATRHHDWDVEDCCILAMKMAGGAFAETAVFGNVGAWRDEFEIYGTQGAVLLRPFGSRMEILSGGKCTTDDLPPHENVHYPLIEDFVESVIGDRAPRCPAAEGAKTTRIMDAAFLSSEEGRTIDLCAGK